MEFIRYILLYKIIQLVHGFRVIWKLNYTAINIHKFNLKNIQTDINNLDAPN